MSQQHSPVIEEHCKDSVLHAVAEFFDENSLAQYTELIQQLSYYALTPGEAKNLGHKKLLDMQRTAIELVSGLAKIYETHHNYTAYKQIPHFP